MKINKIFLTLFLIVFINASEITYEIIEKDFIVEIEEQTPKIEEYVLNERERITKNIDNLKGEILTKAPENKIFYIDPTYVVPEDIPAYDKNGKQIGISYQKGYRFNPVQYMKILPPDLIVFNVCDEFENKYILQLMKDYEEQKKDYMLVNSGCANKDVRKSNFKAKVYFLTLEMVEKFKLKHTISIISINKEKLAFQVKEIASAKNQE